MSESMRLYLVTLLLLFGHIASTSASDTKGDCAGTPESAVMELPAPLSEWAVIVCTRYGHIISNRDGWIWTGPTGYDPVFIPSQMVRAAPEPIGNASHFTEITMTDTTGSSEAREAWKILNASFDQADVPKQAYRLDVAGSLGKSLMLYFFELPDQEIWAIWCSGGNCDAKTKFMLLNMSQSIPENSQDREEV